jgi:stage III sporulation protein AB
MNVLLSIIIIAGTTYIGIGLNNYYLQRERFFSEAQLLCDRLINDINFSHNVLKIVVEDCIDNYKSFLRVCLSRYLEKLKDYGDTGVGALRECIQNKILKDDEFELVLQLLSCLGKSDAEGQIKDITGFKFALSTYLSEAQTDKKRYGGLYGKLGFFMGLTLSIILW